LMEVRRAPDSIDRSTQLGSIANHAGILTKTTNAENQSMRQGPRADHMDTQHADLPNLSASNHLKHDQVTKPNQEKNHKP
ncbi:hypothetical protein RA264_28510, partial [Pseudomonas syringae pv. tagetis]